MTTNSLKVVKPETIREVWPIVRERIAQLAIDNDEPWLAEDVFIDLINARSFLWVTEDCGGFVVVTAVVTPFLRDLHVWIACNDTIARAADYLPEMKRIATLMNCWRVVFESPRRWERALPDVSVRYFYLIDAGV